MYKTAAETSSFFEKFAPLVAESTHAEVVICPTFVNIPAAVESARYSAIGIGAQDVFWLKEGAYTGEVSAPMLVGVGCTWVIIGHSERRQYFDETDESVFKKTVAALDAGLTSDRLRRRTPGGARIGRDRGGLRRAVRRRHRRADAGAVRAHHHRLRTHLGDRHRQNRDSRDRCRRAPIHSRRNSHEFGADAASACRILYGGSVKPDNVKGLMAQPEIDGTLVGGASLDPTSFASIVNF